MRVGGISWHKTGLVGEVSGQDFEDVTEARGARMRGEGGHVWKTELRTMKAWQRQISHINIVCV